MNLSRDSKLVRFSYIFYHLGVPEQTSLCAFFWRTFVWNPIIICGALFMVGMFISLVGHAVWLIATLLGAAHSIALLVFLGGVALLVVLTVKRRPKFKTPVVATVFWQGLKATKSKFCPIIKLT